MSSPKKSLSVGDFVSVERSDKPYQPLKGVIAFMGDVSFAEGSDWVGVRLTGDSVGEGRNDGSVKGKRYFENCGENGGVFVRKASVSKRQPTRLEELRLRRERKASAVVTKKTITSPTSSGRSLAGSAVKSPRASTTSSLKQKPSAASAKSPTPTKTASEGSKVQSEGMSRVKKQMEQIRKGRASLGSSDISTSSSTLVLEKEKEIKNLKQQNDTPKKVRR